MVYLDKERTLIKRDEQGNLLPVEVALEILSDKPLIKVTPLTKGEIQKILSGGTNDDKLQVEDEIMRQHCIVPSYTEEEFKFLKTEVYAAIKIAILSLSTDRQQEDLRKESKDLLVDDDLKKK